MLTHLLDTSAWIAHLKQEAGSEAVSRILANPDNRVGVSALSLVEMHARLRSVNREREFPRVLEEYRAFLSEIAPLDEAVALRAITLRQNAPRRIPAMDSLIAATAAHHNAVLVHRDPHFQTIPDDQLRQLVLDAPQ